MSVLYLQSFEKHHLEKVSKWGGMNNYWDHEPEFFLVKKNVRKSQKFLTEKSDPPPRVNFFKRISDVIFFTAPKDFPKHWKYSGRVRRARQKIKNFSYTQSSHKISIRIWASPNLPKKMNAYFLVIFEIWKICKSFSA